MFAGRRIAAHVTPLARRTQNDSAVSDCGSTSAQSARSVLAFRRRALIMPKGIVWRAQPRSSAMAGDRYPDPWRTLGGLILAIWIIGAIALIAHALGPLAR